MKRRKIIRGQICSALMLVRPPLFRWGCLLALAWNPSSAAELQVREERLCTLPPEAFENSVVVSPDFTRAAFVCEDGSASWVEVNGVATKKYPHLKGDPPLFSPNGSRLAFVAITRERDKSYVVLDGKEWPPVERIAGTNSLLFSPDDKRLALFCGDRDKAFVMLNGVAGPAYEGIGTFRFSPDGQRTAYVATVRKGKQLVVVDGRPGAEYDGVCDPVFSSDSGHLAFMATRGDRQRIVLDGKEQKAYAQIPAIGSTDLPHEVPFFSPNGKRMVYVAGTPGRWRVVEGQSESETVTISQVPEKVRKKIKEYVSDSESHRRAVAGNPWRRPPSLRGRQSANCVGRRTELEHLHSERFLAARHGFFHPRATSSPLGRTNSLADDAGTR